MTPPSSTSCCHVLSSSPTHLKSNPLKGTIQNCTLESAISSIHSPSGKDKIQFVNFPKAWDESQMSLYYNLLLKQCPKCHHREQHASTKNKKEEEPLRSEIINDCAKPPIPRVNAASNGVSYRALPKATCDDLIQVCNFYLEKSKGKYSEKTRAYRYLVEMAEEIKKLTEMIKTEFANEYSKQRSQIIHLNKVCEEWNKHFGKSNDDKYSKATPRDLRYIIDRLENEVKKLEQELKEERLRHYDQERKLHQMINEHHEAARRSVRSMFKQASNNFSSPYPMSSNTATQNLQETKGIGDLESQAHQDLVERLLEENRLLKKKVQELTNGTSYLKPTSVSNSSGSTNDVSPSSFYNNSSFIH
ncbi:hypothetical protein FDP41_011874 [Naegleria fowleri]|uniref:Uncharacterized protein n=1 Tax=Naegleria fowleri TaxID=5763 RepID=A0A6A5BVA4_NAEFO|nr:uncharacterized protein FDP41_011874 [Naegleria fowleri]KAF0982013.1 hypothetical protein FDP41_011874 [Naegleria fowleri]